MDSGQSSSCVPLVKKAVKAEVQLYDVDFLASLIPRIPPEVQSRFEKVYGRLLDLVSISVGADALKAMGAMIQYWNAQLKIFEFPKVDASPTIEEYEILLDIPVPDRLKMYLFTSHLEVSEDLVESLIGVRPGASNLIHQARVGGIKWVFMKKHLLSLIDQENWDLFQPAYALAIYGMVLFPFVRDMIDQAAIDVFSKFVTFQVNPVPAILAETLLAFQRCHQKGFHKIRCCIPLLYVWMMTRFKHHLYQEGTRYPLRKFRNTQAKVVSFPEWKTLFDGTTPRNFGTKCCLYDRHQEIIYSCGDYPNVVLMGPRGCISFTPSLVIGQLKWGMVPVPEERFQELIIWYSDKDTDDGTMNSVRNALKHIRLCGVKELGEHQTFYTEEYKTWRNDRVKNVLLPSPAVPKENKGPSQNEIFLMGKVKLLEAQLEEARCQNEKGDLAVEKLNRRIKGYKEEEESLKRDYAELHATLDNSRLGREVRKKNEEIADLKEHLNARGRALQNARNEKVVMEQSLARAQVELDITQQDLSHSLALFKKYQDALDESHQREDTLKATIQNIKDAHQVVLANAAQREIALSNQVKEITTSYDKLVKEKGVWTETCGAYKDRKELWEKRCIQIVDGLADFTDNWLKIYEEAKREFDFYPDIFMYPGMEALFTSCTKLAKKLKKWRKEDSQEFQY